MLPQHLPRRRGALMRTRNWTVATVRITARNEFLNRPAGRLTCADRRYWKPDRGRGALPKYWPKPAPIYLLLTLVGRSKRIFLATSAFPMFASFKPIFTGYHYLTNILTVLF